MNIPKEESEVLAQVINNNNSCDEIQMKPRSMGATTLIKEALEKVIKNKKKFKNISENIKPVFHIMVGSKAFQVVTSPEQEKAILKMLIHHENAYQDNDNKNWYKLDYVMNIYKEEFND